MNPWWAERAIFEVQDKSCPQKLGYPPSFLWLRPSNLFSLQCLARCSALVPIRKSRIKVISRFLYPLGWIDRLKINSMSKLKENVTVPNLKDSTLRWIIAHIKIRLFNVIALGRLSVEFQRSNMHCQLSFANRCNSSRLQGKDPAGSCQL